MASTRFNRFLAAGLSGACTLLAAVGCASTGHGACKCPPGQCICPECKGECNAKACATCGKSMDQCQCPKPNAMGGPAVKDAKPTKVASFNNVCPVGGDEFDAAAVPVSLARNFKGKTIGFCCPSCTESFDQADEAGKAKIFAEASAHLAK